MPCPLNSQRLRQIRDFSIFPSKKKIINYFPQENAVQLYRKSMTSSVKVGFNFLRNMQVKLE